MSGDIDTTVRALVTSLDVPPDELAREALSPVLAVLTVILSLDERAPGYVEERIKALQSPEPGYGSLSGVRDCVELLTPETYFRIDPRDDGRRAGLFLPLLDALIDGIRDFPSGSEGDRARRWAEAARPSDWTFGPFRGLGQAGFQHLRYLLGANAVIPVPGTREFVEAALGRAVEPEEAIFLLERAAWRLKYDLAGVPASFWAEATNDRSGIPGAASREGK